MGHPQDPWSECATGEPESGPPQKDGPYKGTPKNEPKNRPEGRPLQVLTQEERPQGSRTLPALQDEGIGLAEEFIGFGGGDAGVGG